MLVDLTVQLKSSLKQLYSQEHIRFMRDVTAGIEGEVDDIQESVNDVRETTKVCSFGMDISMLKFG